MKPLCIIGILLLAQSAVAQFPLQKVSVSDSTSQWFDEQVETVQLGIYEGQYSKLEVNSIISTPFLKNRNWQKANIWYKDQIYYSIDVLYDLFKQEIYVKHPDGIKRNQDIIKVRNEYIHQFQIENRLFKYIQSQQFLMATGFYEVLFDSEDITLLCRRKKFKETEYQQLTYEMDHQYFLFVNGEYHALQNKGGIFRLFPDQKKILKSYIKENRLRIKMNGEFDEPLITLINYIESIQ